MKKSKGKTQKPENLKKGRRKVRKLGRKQAELILLCKVPLPQITG